MPFYLFTESYGCPCNSILKNTYLTSENAGTMNKLHYVGVMYCGFILIEMRFDLACTLLN